MRREYSLDGGDHGSIVGPEGCDELGGGEALKRFWLKRIQATQKSFLVISLSPPAHWGQDHRISVPGLGIDFLRGDLQISAMKK